MLVDGHSTLDTERVSVDAQPQVATWLWSEDRTNNVRLVANTKYWDSKRGPHLSELVFRNDLDPQRALDLVCMTEGEVDILTDVVPADAARVEKSEHAKLVAINAIRAVVGIIDRDAVGLPFSDARARRALNFAIDRKALVADVMFGRAERLASLTPAAALPMVAKLVPYAHDAKRAATLWREAGGCTQRVLRIATIEKYGAAAASVARDLKAALGVQTNVTVQNEREAQQTRRALAERRRPRPWDILIWEQGTQEAEGAPLELHRAFVGETGEYRTGPVVPEFEALYAELVSETSMLKQALISNRIDRFVYDEALALFLFAPQALYAVNRHVNFTPYRTTFELAECSVSAAHWSRRNVSKSSVPS